MATVVKVDIGQRVKCRAICRNENGALADPTTLVATFENPAGTPTSYTYGTDAQLVKTATGEFYFYLTPTTSGTWTVKFTGTGTVPAAKVDTILVRETALG